MFMELSRLFFDGAPELHLANFLHMIATMAESGSTEEQMEFFILNSQKMVKLPVEEYVWSLSSELSSMENDELTRNALLSNINDQLKSKKKPVYSWPPVDWKTAPGFSYSRANGFRTQPGSMDQSGGTEMVEGCIEASVQEEAELALTDINEDVEYPESTILPVFDNESDPVYNQPLPMEALADPTNIVVESLCPEEGQTKSRDQSSNLGAQEAMRIGKLGELVAYKYFAGKADGKEVKWVNQEKETGLPFDIVISDEQNLEYVEVKASRYAKKDWFVISAREWQFATEKGDAFSIAYVILSAQNPSRIIIYKNPVKLCRLGKLQLTVTIPKPPTQSV